jgi:hypothetical protein
MICSSGKMSCWQYEICNWSKNCINLFVQHWCLLREGVLNLSPILRSFVCSLSLQSSSFKYPESITRLFKYPTIMLRFFKFALLPLLLLLCLNATSQNVGIGTAAPLDKLHVAGNVRVNPLAGVGTRVVGSDLNGTLVNIAPGTAGQVLTQTAGGPVFQDPGALTVTSTSATTDITISNAAWANVAGISVTFTATKTSALLMFTTSGFAYTNSMAYVQFRVRNGATVLGGTNAHMQNYDDVTGTVTPWSAAFTKNITGLTVGASYTFQVQAQRGGIFGTYDAAIYCATQSDSHHMTLTVLQ